MSIAKNPPRELAGDYTLLGSHRLVCSTGAVTTIAARTATAGQLFQFRWPSSTSARCFVRYVGAKFTLTTAYGTAQETGCDLIVARSFTVNGTDGTAVDVGSTVTDTNKLMENFSDSLITAGCVRVATTAAITAGTHTLDANPIGILSDWSTGIGSTVPLATSGAGSSFGTLFDARAKDAAPIILKQDEGLLARNLVLMGATGVGRWDFCIEWDEGVPA
jgi:hypothetical protein